MHELRKHEWLQLTCEAHAALLQMRKPQLMLGLSHLPMFLRQYLAIIARSLV
jgi:hypothetical protein